MDLSQEFLTTRRAAGEAIARLPRKEMHSLLAYDARQLVQEISRSGVQDRAAETADLDRATALARKGWPGQLAAMLLTPAWQWPSAPLLLEVPKWLLVDYVGWLFTVPQSFCAVGQAETYAAHTVTRLEELVRWMNRAPGVDAETEVIGAYVTQASAIPLYCSPGDLRRHAELRSLLYQRVLGQPGDRKEVPLAPREGRRLRIGFVNRVFGPQTETSTTLPTFEHLDPERWEVMLFACVSDGNAVEEHCRQHAAEFFPLPQEMESQLAILRAAGLDVVIFGTNLTADANAVTRLALHRIAPLQVATQTSCSTTGLAEIDLFVSGTLAETAQGAARYSERLGLLPGPGQCFNFNANRQEPQHTFTRASLGLPETGLLFVSAAHRSKIIPEVQHAWARLLAAVPGAHLLWHPFNPKWPAGQPLESFRTGFQRVLTSHGVEDSRLVFSSGPLPTRADVQALLGLGDVYLDTFPFGGASSLVDPLELGLPVVTCDGQTMRSRVGGSLLRSLELPELIASDAEGYHAIALQLALDPDHRASVRAKLQERMGRLPIFLDALAGSDALGDLLETAYDELVQVGRAAFRSNPLPLRAGRTTPADPLARHVLGRALLDAGRTDRAIDYLLAAIQHTNDNPDLWLDLARALKMTGRISEAIQALEASLRMNENQLEGWLMLAELAQTVGVMDLARDAAGIAQKLAPDDPRPAAFLRS